MTLGGKQNVFDLQFASQNVENVTTVYKNKIKIDEKSKSKTAMTAILNFTKVLKVASSALLQMCNVFQQETSCKLFDRNSVWHKM